MAKQSTNIKIEENLKKEAQDLFAELGLDMTTAVNMFLAQAVKEQAIPFRVGAPKINRETLDAMNEVKEMKNNPSFYKGYTSVDDMMEDILY